ncbi:MAG: MASE1 domain-containing protein [Cyclobacteriaceae bacterium]|nr:MASE1 domain-containing protein [Cyclobacteriaceae bacterium]
MKLHLTRSADFNVLLVALMYYVAAETGFLLSFESIQALPFWPPAGIALAMVILKGRKVWPGIAIGSLIIIVKSAWFGSVDSVQMLMAVTSIITVSAVLEAIAGEYLFGRLVKSTYPFAKAIHIFQFLFITLLISWISTGGTVLALTMSGVLASPEWASALITLWMRNVVGILLFCPLLLALPGEWTKPSLLRMVEMILFPVSCSAVFFLLRLESLAQVAPYAMAFVAIPFLLWMAFRFEVVVAIAGYMVASLAAIYFTSQQAGPFYLPELEADSIALLQVYVVVISVSTLVLSAAVRERQQAQQALEKLSENLEAAVQHRTKELEGEIQHRQEAQNKLQSTNEELVKRNTELDNFVYSVSHDLRAPIASILGLVNLAKTDSSANVKTMYLDMMEKSARQQDHFIREILDQSRNARLEVKREPVQFKTLIEEAFEQVDYANLNGKQVEKVINVDQHEPFYSDKWRLKVILNNVISNAIRYKNGKDPVVKVNARIDRHRVKLTIQDNGKGIEKKHLSQLGKMFYRATDEGAGSGLGLYIVKEALNKLKGSMAIESEEGLGTTVNFEIPEIKLN